MHIMKENQDEEFWPRLLADKNKEKTNVKIDWDRYVDEAFAVLEEDYLGADKRSPQGFSMARLASDLTRVTA